MTRRGAPLLALLCLGLLAGGAGVASAQPAEAPWRPFSGTWSLSGERHELPTERERAASIVHVSGPLVLGGGGDLGAGFLGEVIGYDDGGALLAGRAVLTDSKGDRVYATLKAEPIGAGRKATATITGGTGRYADVEGSFTFAWQYAVAPDAREIELRAVDVDGRARRKAR